jgi:hypothetical protein
MVWGVDGVGCGVRGVGCGLRGVGFAIWGHTYIYIYTHINTYT